MHTATFLSGWDTLIVMAPLVGLMALGMFGVDGKMASPQSDRKHPRTFCTTNQGGQSSLTDPDGRPWISTGSNADRTSVGVSAVDAMRVQEILAELREDRRIASR